MEISAERTPDGGASLCGCARTMPRREFITLSGLAAGAAALCAAPLMAGPFETAGFARLVPPDKKLRPQWIRSLTAPGSSTVYSSKRDELRFIGMPVGGICAGTLYLGGDGRLWLWDIFNENKNGIRQGAVKWDGFGQERVIRAQDGSSYVAPRTASSPLEQGFKLKVNGVERPMDSTGWSDVSFVGEYPIGTVTYADPGSQVSATLVAYSPFIPLNVDDSSLPAVICEFTLSNTGADDVDAEIAGWLENACSLLSAAPGSGQRVNTIQRSGDSVVVSLGLDALTIPIASGRSDVTLDDFEHLTYGAWKVEGTAFGTGPIERTAVPAYQGDPGGAGKRIVNSHASAPGHTVQEKDSATGRLTSPPFKIERRYLSFYIGGGENVDEVGLELLIADKPVRRAAGPNDNRMRRAAFDVREFEGQIGLIRIYDRGVGGWGNIGVDDIVQTDAPAADPPAPSDHDFGSMALALLGEGDANPDVSLKDAFGVGASESATKPVGEKLIGAVLKKVTIPAGESRSAQFAVAWHFPNNGLKVPDAETGNAYAARFPDAAAITRYIAVNYDRLSSDTSLWHKTWYDSTLPHWLLDRTFVNTSILATSTAHRFATGRFWAWEGIGCCEGTCTHVWHYAQAVGRLFPEIERHTREFVDFGIAFDETTGIIGYRGEGTGPAIDGQCGRILGAYREHQMSADSSFLGRIFPRVRRAMEFLMRHDSDGDGLLDGAQENTLDAAWYGKIAWLSSLYAAALRASEEMAREVGDLAFAAQCGDKFRQSRHTIETELFNGEYFIQKPDPTHAGSLGTYETCHIDQVHGQSWACQVGLGRILDSAKTLSALRALYRYNFTMDVGPFRRKNLPGRAYALAGDAGLIVATNPRDLPEAYGNVSDWQYGYFNECMTGFEHQAASHMIAEGLVLEGLAVTRAVHDRYHGSRRNPYNEIECSDHYSRAMASYGTFVAVCGFKYHGPRGEIGFDPRLSPDRFRAAFTAAEGWGTFAQRRTGGKLKAEIHLRHGRLRLNTVTLSGEYRTVSGRLDRRPLPLSVTQAAGQSVVTLPSDTLVLAGQTLALSLS